MFTNMHACRDPIKKPPRQPKLGSRFRPAKYAPKLTFILYDDSMENGKPVTPGENKMLPFTPSTHTIKGKRSKRRLPPWWNQLANSLTPDADLIWRPAARVPPFRFHDPTKAARDVKFDGALISEVQDWVEVFYDLPVQSGNEWFFFDIYPSATWVNLPEVLSLLERVTAFFDDALPICHNPNSACDIRKEIPPMAIGHIMSDVVDEKLKFGEKTTQMLPKGCRNQNLFVFF